MSDRITHSNEVVEVELDTTQLLALALPTDENGNVGFNPYDTGAFRALGYSTRRQTDPTYKKW